MNILQATQIAEEIIEMYQQYGSEQYAGERITQMEHMVQAAELARIQGCSDETILAAFLHDIGHICANTGKHQTMDNWGIMDHEEVGAVYLKARGFSRKVIRLVESHVEAKRYLTFKDPAYYSQLSEASRQTLDYQGGKMSEEEAVAFEQYPLFAEIILMRLLDEKAKIEDAEIPDLTYYKHLIIAHLQQQ
jgi:2-amino-1-hydroxyethylphosphonate dioxygenase (glycine-forming)